MPQNPLPDVIFATLLQRYEFYLNLPNFLAIIIQKSAYLLTYNLLTFDICIPGNLETEVLLYI